MFDALTVDLQQRIQEPEWMDRPDCDLQRLQRTLKQFALINRWVARYRTLLAHYVVQDMQRDPEQAYHLLDLGTGAADIPRWLLKQARRLHLNLQITGVDADPRVGQWLREQHDASDSFEFVEADVLEFEDPGNVDYVFANHLLHHLDRNQIIRLLDRIAAIRPRVLILSDLRRQRSSLLAYSLFAGLCLRGSFAYDDGRRSIRRGFTPAELQEMIAASKLAGRADVRSMFPGRLAIVAGTSLVDGDRGKL